MKDHYNRSILVVGLKESYFSSLQSDKNVNLKITFTYNPIDALAQCAKCKYDLVIAADYFNEMSGFNFLVTTKHMNPNTITELALKERDDMQELIALQSEVDGVIKMDSGKELNMFYIQKFLKDTRQFKAYHLQSEADDITVNLESYEVMQGDDSIQLAPKEYRILVALLKNKDIVLTRGQIIKEIWDEDFGVIDDRTLNVHIGRLRKKLNTKSIVSIRGIGYKWAEKRRS